MNRTRDFRVVKRLAGSVPSLGRDVIYLNDSNEGIWMLHPYSDGLMVHAFMTAKMRGKRAVSSLRRALSWAVENTPFRCVYAAVPKESRHAGFLAVWAGMCFTHEESNVRYYRWVR